MGQTATSAQKQSDLRSLLSGYQSDTQEGMPERIAKLLAFVREKHPDAYVPYNWIAKCTHNEGRLPSETSLPFQRAKSAMTSARAFARKHFGAEITSMKGFGARMTTSDDDVVETQYANANRRVAAALRSQATVATVVNPRNLKSDANKRYFNATRKALKAVNDERTMTRLLGPGSDE